MKTSPASLALVLAACGVEPPLATIDTTPRVEVVAVAPPPTALERTLLSTLEPAQDAIFGAMRPGRVVARLAQPGTPVGRDAPLLRLDDREAVALLAQARAAEAEARAVLAEAERTAVRVGALGDGASGAQQDAVGTGVARARAAVDAAAAQVQLAELNLAYLTLRAPFAGELAWLDPDVGEAIAAGMPVARVVDLSGGKVTIGLLEDEVGPARDPAASFAVRADAREVAATLAHVSPAADPRTLDWKAELRVEGMPFPAGTPVEVVVRLPVAGAEGVLPPRTVVDGAVWVVEGAVARRVPVTVVGEAREGLLVSGLALGASVVLHAVDPLTDGEPVVVVAAPPRAPGATPGGAEPR